MPQIKEQYIKTGKVQLIYRDFPLVSIHSNALLAAHAANCAVDQGKFWEMHDRLFIGQIQRQWGNENAFTTFVGYAKELGLDTNIFQECVNNNTYADLINRDYREATSKGINSTPSFVVNGQVILGARPFSYWRQLFDSLLEQQPTKP